MNSGTSSYLQGQSLGSSRMSQLAMIETADSISPACLTAVGQYRSNRTENATANSTLLSNQFDSTDSTNSEVQQLNLLNAAEAQKLSEMQAQGNASYLPCRADDRCQHGTAQRCGRRPQYGGLRPAAARG